MAPGATQTVVVLYGDPTKAGVFVTRVNLMVWREMLNADCPRRDARIHDRCDLVCPDLPKVL